MSLSEALEKLKPTPLKLLTTPKLFRPAGECREDFRELDVTIESLHEGRLRLSHNGNTEELDLAGATFAAVPRRLVITFPADNKSIVLSDRRALQ